MFFVQTKYIFKKEKFNANKKILKGFYYFVLLV